VGRSIYHNEGKPRLHPTSWSTRYIASDSLSLDPIVYWEVRFYAYQHTKQSIQCWWNLSKHHLLSHFATALYYRYAIYTV